MPNATLRRPDSAVVLFESSAHIKSRPAALFASLHRRLDPGPDAVSGFVASKSGFRIVTEGGGWYRAEFQVIPDVKGCIIEHFVLDSTGSISTQSRSVQKVLEQAPSSFEKLIRLLRAELE
ncbi:MAG: hypothetical protein IT191_03865 [Microbacteriaceae bacterium]|nr:hypothetical protein [Microbacteriaceae bacterium]